MRKLAFIAVPVAALAALVVLLSAGGSNSPAASGDRALNGDASQTQADGAPSTADKVVLPLAPGGSSSGSYSSGVAGGPATGASGGTSTLPPSDVSQRKIVRTATLEVTVDDVGGAVQQVENAALGAGGFVSGSSLTVENPGASSDQPKRQRATITVRVPAEAYASVMARLRGFAKEVKSENSETSEVTEEYTDLQARQRNLEATEARYLDLLAKAESINDILTVQDRLSSVRAEIEQVQGRIKLLDDLTDLATITVQLSLPPVTAVEPQAQPGWAREALDNAWDGSKDVTRVLGTAGITGGVVLAWLLIPGLLGLIGWRIFGPRAKAA